MINLIKKKQMTVKLKRKFEADTIQSWGASGELRVVLGDLIPERVGKGFIEKMKVLSKELNDVQAAKDLLTAKRDERKQSSLVDIGLELKPRDLEAALSEVRLRKRRVIEPVVDEAEEQALCEPDPASICVESCHAPDSAVKQAKMLFTIGVKDWIAIESSEASDKNRDKDNSLGPAALADTSHESSES